ncbi:Cysteamine dioxygenase [Macleaya cordata]|uniref:cysteine dioxygenase n=1 Tax=Macleaya cordata TaxID=56857 RepID=A0A200R193_MACCD|nr:Cysteamine dioxygenase [Macleaya cordata]
MTMEARLVGKKRSNVVLGNTNNIIRNKNNNNNKKRCINTKRCSTKKPTMALQKLFVACTEVFKGPGTVPPPPDVQNLRHILDNMTPEDVGLSTDLLFFKSSGVAKGTPSITYTTIYKCEKFSMCLFFLPPSAVIPLHNHPGMTVFNKLLLGTMHIKSYDWADPDKLDDSVPSSQLRLARLKADNVFTAPCNTSVLYPTTGGNIHAFTAITPCAVLDVFGPPYSKEDGRDCSYYRDFPCSDFIEDGSVDEALGEGRNSYGMLEEIEMPKDLKMQGIEYLGPQVMETRC